MDAYVSYLRVSTDRQGRSGLGLEAQREAIAGFLHIGHFFQRELQHGSGREMFATQKMGMREAAHHAPAAKRKAANA